MSIHFRIGEGWDIHALVPGRPLVLGGVHIPHSKGLLGHSDADALAHAITDALLGAAGLGDIRDNFADIEAARALLGFTPKVDFATGIRRFAAWVDGQAVRADTYDQSIAEMKAKGLYK